MDRCIRVSVVSPIKTLAEFEISNKAASVEIRIETSVLSIGQMAMLTDDLRKALEEILCQRSGEFAQVK